MPKAPPPTPLSFHQPILPWQGSTTAVMTAKFMFKRQIKLPCKFPKIVAFLVPRGEMVKLKEDLAPSDAHRVRKQRKAEGVMGKAGKAVSFAMKAASSTNLVVSSANLVKGALPGAVEEAVSSATQVGTHLGEDETEKDFYERRDADVLCFPTYDELGPHPPLEPSIFSNTRLKCGQNKIAPEGVTEELEYWVDGKWVGMSEVGPSTFSRPQTRDLTLTKPSTLT